MNERPKPIYSPARLSARVAQMGRIISRDHAGRTLDVVVILENALVFAADLIRHVSCPTVCHFVRVEVRDIQLGGYDRREIFFTPELDLRDRHVLIVDMVLHSGVTLDFLVKRVQETRPKSVRVAVLLNKERERRVDLKPDYVGFPVVSKHLVGYGLAGRHGWYRNLRYVGSLPLRGQASRRGQRRKR